MSQDAKETRPGQATFAGWLIMGGSIIVVITAWERISGLTTMESRESLESVLAEPPFSGTGMSVGDLTTLVRIGCMAAAAAATAAAILGFHVLKRSTSARLALSILAPVVLVGGFATAGFFAPLVVAGIVMLWLYPTREWFAGQPWSQRPGTTRHRGKRVDPDLPDPFTKPEQDAESGPPPDPDARPVAEQGPSPAPVAVSNFGAPTAYAVRPAPQRRPAALVWACAMVWAMGSLVSGLMVLLSVVLLVAREDFFAEVERQQPGFDFQGFSQTEITGAVFAMTGVVLLWSAAAAVLAYFAFRRANWARIALLASTVAVGVVCLAMVFASPPMVVVVGSAAVTTWLLLRPEVVTWFRDTGS